VNNAQILSVWKNIPTYAAFFEVTKPYSFMEVGDTVYMRPGDPTTVIHKATDSRAYIRVSCLKFLGYFPMSGRIPL